jgi:hypothetical protein
MPRRPHRAGAGEMVIDLPPHRRRLAHDRVLEIRRVGGGGVHDDGERGLERMGEVARMGARFLGLLLVMREQAVQLLDHRQHLVGHRLRHAALFACAHPDDLAPQRPQGAQAIDALDARHQEQPHAEQREALDQCRAQCADLAVQPGARLRHRENPAVPGAGDDHRPLHHAQALVRELVAVIDAQVRAGPVDIQLQRAVPERAGAPVLMAPGADLVIEAAIGFEEALVRQRAVEEHLAIRADLGGCDHRRQA